jgi:hypothetical protein
MKKYLLSLLIAFFAVVFCKINAQPGIGFGIKAGINYSDQVTSGKGENVNVRSIIRFNGGAYFNLFLLDKIAVQPELMISGKGSDWDDPAYDVKDLLTYIDIPVLFRYQVIDMLNLHAGPQFGYLLSANQKDKTSGEVINIDDYYKKPDLGIVLGAEANLPYKINLTVRYVIGLIPTSSDEEYIDPWLNNFFQISVGYRFKGK